MRVFTAALIAACATGRAEDPPAWPKITELPAITSGNASRLHLAAQLGSPTIDELQWSLDGRHLGLRSSAGIKLYSFEPDKATRLSKGKELAGDKLPVSFCFRSREDEVFTCDGGREITLWDIRSGWAKERISDAGAGVKAVAFSPTAPLLAAVTDDGALRVWRGEVLSASPQLFKDHANGASGVSIDAKGKFVVTWAGWNDVNVRNLESGELTASITTGTSRSGGILSPAFIGPDGDVWANATGKTLRWSLPGAEPLPPSPVRALLGPGCFHRDGARCLAYVGKSIGVVTLGDGKSSGKVIEHNGMAVASFEPTKGSVFAVCFAGKIALHDVKTGAQIFSEAIGEPANAVGFSTDKSSVLYTTTAPGVRVVDLTKGGKGIQLSLSPDVRFPAATLDEKAKIAITAGSSAVGMKSEVSAWKLTGSRLKRLPSLDKEQMAVRSFALNKKGDLIALGAGPSREPTVKLIVIESGKVNAAIKLPAQGQGTPAIIGLEFDPSGKLLAAATSGRSSPALINVNEGKTDAILPLPGDFDSWFRGVRFSSNGALLAAPAFNGALLIYDVKSRTLKAQPKLDGELLGALDFSPDGNLLACGVQQRLGWKAITEIVVLVLESGELITRFPAHAGPMIGLEFLPNGKAIASFAHNDAIRVWAVTGAKETSPTPGPK